MKALHVTTLFLFAALLLPGCGQKPEAIVACESKGDFAAICGLEKPEDMELLPDRRTLLISELGGIDGKKRGSLVLYDTVTGSVARPAWSDGTATDNWGAADCPGAPVGVLAPHGIHLGDRANGRRQLLVVNHGGRESVEFFEISAGSEGYQLQWRGCVVAPPGSMLNDVAALPGGGFLATHMLDANSPQLAGFSIDYLKGALGFDTGHVIRWDGARFDIVPGTGAAVPNGIQLSADGRHLYLNAYMGGEVRKISYPDGKLEGKADVAGPDNSQWDASGRLLVASHTHAMGGISACFEIQQGACGAAFTIVALNPETMAAETLVCHEGAPMGAATVAQQVGESLYIGSFVGDRMLRVRLPARGTSVGCAPAT